MPQIHIPTLDHIDQIIALNRRHLVTDLTNGQVQSSFVRIAYTQNDLRKIIAEREMVIASDNGIVVGYYLIGKKSNKPELNYQRNKAESLFDTYSIGLDKIGYGCQVVIAEQYRNMGLFGYLLQGLTQLVANKYRLLLCSVSAANTQSVRSHLNNGWRRLDDMDSPNYYQYTIKKNILECSFIVCTKDFMKVSS